MLNVHALLNRRPRRASRACLGLAALLAASPVLAQSKPGQATGAGWQFGAVIDTAHLSQAVPLGLRDQGLGLGHSDLLARGTLGRHLSAEAVAVVSTEEGRLERRTEKLFVQTRTLPAGFQARLGRFASQVGYLNEQHPHADDFVERPPLYRAFLGHHYFDDGLRLNWTAPTPFLLQLGAEGFSGRKLTEEGPRRNRAGVSTLSIKVGADIDQSQAWQAGAALLTNRRAASLHEGHDDDHGDGHLDAPADDHALHEEGHAHGAAFAGRRLALYDLAWKWAPNGNPREQQVRVVVEHARLSGLPQPALGPRRHEGSSLAVVWRWRPDWEVGLRADRLRAAFVHDGHLDPARLDEQSAMLVYKPSHKQALRLQWTTNRKAEGFEAAARRTVALQYVVAFGVHGAHPF